MVLHKDSVKSHHLEAFLLLLELHWCRVEGVKIASLEASGKSDFQLLLFAPPAAPVENSGVCAEGKPLTYPLHRQQGHPAVLSHQRASVVRWQEELQGCVGSRCV